MTKLKMIPQLTASLVLLGAVGGVAAQTMPASTGYWQDARGNIVKNTYGQCWRTSSWTPALAVAACDPSLMPKPEAVVAVKASPAPAPAPVMAAPAPVTIPAPAPKVTWQTKITEKPVRLDGASFAVGSSRLQSGDIAGLEEVVKTAREHPEINFAVEGYTSNTGGEQMNMRLSQDRADSVKQYLASKGVDANRITTKGFGEASPIADNNTAQGREENRRVEIRYTVKEETRVQAQR